MVKVNSKQDLKSLRKKFSHIKDLTSSAEQQLFVDLQS